MSSMMDSTSKKRKRAENKLTMKKIDPAKRREILERSTHSPKQLRKSFIVMEQRGTVPLAAWKVRIQNKPEPQDVIEVVPENFLKFFYRDINWRKYVDNPDLLPSIEHDTGAPAWDPRYIRLKLNEMSSSAVDKMQKRQRKPAKRTSMIFECHRRRLQQQPSNRPSIDASGLIKAAHTYPPFSEEDLATALNEVKHGFRFSNYTVSSAAAAAIRTTTTTTTAAATDTTSLVSTFERLPTAEQKALFAQLRNVLKANK